VAAAPAPAVSAERLLEWAGEMEAAGRVDLAARALNALTTDPALPIRQEARFRLAQIAARAGRHPDAALLYRAILDEQPGAQRVRLELAAVLDRMGDEAGARQAIREAQAGGLPPDIARFVDRYAAALRARKRFGFSADIAVAPDSNINRATRSDTVGTVIGDFDLAEDAKARSGVGLALGGQAFFRTKAKGRANLILRGGANANLYRDGRFNDLGTVATVGPELRMGEERLAIEGGIAGRWFGGRAYSRTASVTVTWLHPLGRTAQLRTIASVGSIDNRRNPALDGMSYAVSVAGEKALCARTGIGMALAADRQALADPGWSTTGGRMSAFGYRELGRTTAILNLELGRLEADERLALFPRRRVDTSVRAVATLTARQFAFGQFAPLLRITAERNRSTVEIYDYRRKRFEMGITRAF
jgi:tetratricopeptide (TPR) repeat protein